MLIEKKIDIKKSKLTKKKQTIHFSTNRNLNKNLQMLIDKINFSLG